jgi:hypothetical protein
MERRVYKRIPANLYVRFFYGSLMCTGIVVNYSEDGMCIKTRKCLPVNSRFDLLIPLIDEVLKIPFKTVRLRRTGDTYKGIGIKVLEQPKNYLKLVRSLRTAYLP